MRPRRSRSERARIVVLAVIAGLGLAPVEPTCAQVSDLRFETLVSGLDAPTFVTHAGDQRLFVVERSGLVRVVRGSTIDADPFLDLRARVLAGGERGLLSIAFHPAYPEPGFVYAYYTRAGDGAVVVSRFTVAAGGERLDAASEAVLLVVPQPFANHNGGQLQFGPDGMLYVGLGDGGSANDPQCFAQRTDSLLGKMLRLDVDANAGSPPFYSVPRDNPYAGAGGAPGEIWASGLRNPWRFSFDRVFGDLWIGDVGQGGVEEIDRQPVGSPGGFNWGWKFLEGDVCVSASGLGCPLGGTFGSGCDDPALEPPVITYGHQDGNCSVTGGYRYRGSVLPEIYGDYFYGDFCSGRVWRAHDSPGGFLSVELEQRVAQLSSFGEDREGELLAVSLDGRVLRLTGPTAEGGGLIQWRENTLERSETAGIVIAAVERIAGASGAVAVSVEVTGGDAIENVDFRLLTDRVEWGDGEDGAREVRVELLDDALAEPDERVLLGLRRAVGNATIAAAAEVQVIVLDDERRAIGCAADDQTLCLNAGRFRVRARWRDFEDRSGAAGAAPLTADSGTFWFFDPDNVELVVKVLDACVISGRYWVFATGLTNVATRLEVVDTRAGEVAVYESALGAAFVPVLDTAAFLTCP